MSDFVFTASVRRQTFGRRTQQTEVKHNLLRTETLSVHSTVFQHVYTATIQYSTHHSQKRENPYPSA